MLSRQYMLKLIVIIVFISFLTVITVPWKIYAELDDTFRMIVGDEHNVNTEIPLFLHVRADKEGLININGIPVSTDGNQIDLSSVFTIEALTEGQVNLKLSIFDGLITLRNITVNVFPEKHLFPGGHSIGIKLHDGGVIAVGFYMLENEKGTLASPAEESGVKIGDIILKVGGYEVNSLDEAANYIDNYSKKGSVPVQIKRNNELLEMIIPSTYSIKEEAYKIGLFIRDTAAGVGTLTFIDPDKNQYGALGHVITEIESNQPLNIYSGAIVKADIINIKEAQKGRPGEKAGIFREGDEIRGSILKNTQYGIFGCIKKLDAYTTPYPDPLPLGLIHQIEEGPAEILTVIDGDKIESFTVFIERIVYQNKPADKGLIIKVVDERLIDLTGGIIQGMSGSPIIQNGYIVGAVTHVFINDPTKGYGVLAEWMFEETYNM